MDGDLFTSQNLERVDARLLEAVMEPATDDAVPLAQVIAHEIRLHADLVKAAVLVAQSRAHRRYAPGRG